MGDRVQAVVTHQYPVSADVIFECWLRPASIREWMRSALKAMGLSGEMGIVEVNSRVGGRFCFSDRRPTGEAFHWGSYWELDFPTKIAFTWNAGEHVTETDDDSSLVEITLTETSTGCDVELVHSMDSEWEEYLEQTEKGWRNMLTSIGQFVASRTNAS